MAGDTRATMWRIGLLKSEWKTVWTERSHEMMQQIARKYLNFQRPVSLAGRRFQIPVWGGLEAWGITDSWKTEVIARLAGDGPFVDVGVNLGQTLLDLRATHRDVDYIGFEPNPLCVAYVQKLIRANNFDRCRVAPVGLADDTTVRALFPHANAPVDSAASMVEDLRDRLPRRPVVVATFVFDEIGRDLTPAPPHFVKIDVEGLELEVLRGMGATLADARPIVLCEVLPRAGGRSESETGTRKQELADLLLEAGYETFRILPNQRSGARIEVNETTRFLGGEYDPKESYDYLFLPDDRARSLLRKLAD